MHWALFPGILRSHSIFVLYSFFFVFSFFAGSFKAASGLKLPRDLLPFRDFFEEWPILGGIYVLSSRLLAELLFGNSADLKTKLLSWDWLDWSATFSLLLLIAFAGLINSCYLLLIRSFRDPNILATELFVCGFSWLSSRVLSFLTGCLPEAATGEKLATFFWIDFLTFSISW